MTQPLETSRRHIQEAQQGQGPVVSVDTGVTEEQKLLIPSSCEKQ